MKIFKLIMFASLLSLQCMQAADIEENIQPLTRENLKEKNRQEQSLKLFEEQDFRSRKFSEASESASEKSPGYSSKESDLSKDSITKKSPQAKTLHLTFDEKIQNHAQGHYATTRLFKDSLTQKYIARAQELSEEVQKMLLNEKISTPETIHSDIAKLNKAIAEQKQYSGLWIFGKRSNDLIEELEDLKEMLQAQQTVWQKKSTAKSETISNVIVKKEEPKISEEIAKQLQQVEQTLQARIQREEQSEATENRRRSLAIENATPAKATDYVHHSTITIDPKTGKTELHVDKVKDQKRTVLLQEIKKLEDELTSKNEDSDQALKIKAEIEMLQKQLRDHHQSLDQELRTLYAQNLKKAGQLDNDIQKLNEEINSDNFKTTAENYLFQKEKAETLLQDLKTIKAKLDALNREITTTFAQKITEDQQITKATLEIEKLKKQVTQLRETKNQTGVANLVNRIQNLEKTITDIKNLQTLRLKRSHQTSDKKTDDLENMRTSILENHPNLQKEIQEVQATINHVEKQYENFQKSYENKMALLKSSKNENETQKTKIEKLINYHKAYANTWSSNI